MRDHDTGGYVGHSNDSLMAGADEMAGHTPVFSTNDSAPMRDATAQTDSDNSVTVSRFTPNDSDPFMDVAEMELHYPMPDVAVPWYQADHPDSITRLMHEQGDPAMEAFRGAARIFSHSNPEVFLMPLESPILCMKVDNARDMKYCIANGAVTNLPSCNTRIQAAWDERNGQKVFMMFSISGDKEFCALAEMKSNVRPGSLPGWSKSGCTGVVLVTFIYIKNVPFKLINHIKNKANRQPVANMWNSMLYQDNTGYHVAKIFVEHPVLSSLLVTYRTEMQTNYKSQLRIASSGNTTYSASSYGSQNDKSHDPRSATRVMIYRSGNANRIQSSGSRRDGIQAQPWRRDGIPETPPRALIAGTDNATPATTIPQHHGAQKVMVQASPPTYAPAEGSQAVRPATSRSSGSYTTPAFTTADDRIFAEFATSRSMKNQELALTSQSNGGHQQTHSNVRGSFRNVRASRNGRSYHQTAAPPAPINTDRRNMATNVGSGHNGNPYDVRWENDGRSAQVPILMDNSAGNDFGGPYLHQGQALARDLTHYPSPDTSTQTSYKGSSQQSEQQHGQSSQGFTTPSTPFAQHDPTKNHFRTAPQSAQRLITAATLNSAHGGQNDAAKPPSPMKHSQSMPLMPHQPSHRLSVKLLNAHATSFTPKDAKALHSSSSPVHDWVSETPTRASFEADLALIKSTSLTTLTPSDAKNDYSPDKTEETIRFLNLEQQIKWHQARFNMMEAEIALGLGGPDSTAQKVHLLKWHKANVESLKFEMVAAHNRHEEARGDLAQPTEDHPPQSPGTPHNSDHWPKKASGSSIESAFVEPEVGDNGKILRSVSKTRRGKATHIDQVDQKQKLRHARGRIGSQGFSKSFDARMRASVNDLTASPALLVPHLSTQPVHTHSHPLQRSSGRLDIVQYDSANDDQCSQGDSCTEEDDASSFDVASQIDIQEHQGNVFPLRGRGYYPTQQPARDESQASHHGGANVQDEYSYN